VELLARGTPIWPGILPAGAVVAGIIYLLGAESIFTILAGVVFLIAPVPLLLFFRDPQRRIAEGVVSPADGKVVEVTRKGGDWWYVSIFMNVHNVHVNRAPWGGAVLSQEHVPGGYVPAFNKESNRNERVITRLRTNNGTWVIKQIAGAVARRIVPYVSEGQRLEKGERLGMIRFGSRVDLDFRMPRGMSISVRPGDRVKAGSDEIAGMPPSSSRWSP
jgi:phosphatidylserine decarboxylase